MKIPIKIEKSEYIIQKGYKKRKKEWEKYEIKYIGA